MEEKSIRDQILEANEKSKVFLERVKACPEDVALVEDSLRMFIWHRFFIVEEAPATDDIGELAALSMKKVIAVNKQGVLQDLSNNCAGVSSETMKKALLIMTLQKNLGIVFSPDATDAIPGLAAEIAKACRSEAEEG